MAIQKPPLDWEGKRILVLGDIMLDRYLYGQTHRTSPEAPVPILDLERETERLGGAANVALNLLQLGAEPLLAGVVGADAEAGSLMELCARKGLSTSAILRDGGRPTTTKSRVWANQQQLLRIDRESTEYLPDALTEKLAAVLAEQLPQMDALVLQDYNKGVLSPTLIQKAIAMAGQAGIPITADPKKDNFWAYMAVTLFKPNLKEIRAQLPFGVAPGEAESLRAADTFIRTRIAPDICMITLSEYGVFISDGDFSERFPTTPAAVVDVCGAGDTVLSVATLALAAKMPLPEIGRLANIAGGLACAKQGVMPVSLEELAKAWAE